MRIILGGLTLPRHAKLSETPDPEYAKIITKGGKLSVDVWNVRRSWTIQFPLITKAEWAAINAKFLAQFVGSGSMTSFETIAEGPSDQVIPATTVFINPSKRELKWAGTHAEGYSLVLDEENAIG